jgi:hypothetical protein
MSRKSESKTEIAAARVPGQAQRLSLFGPPLLLEGEDAAAYDELLARVCAAVKPVDVIDEMLIADIVVGVGTPPMAPLGTDFDARART